MAGNPDEECKDLIRNWNTNEILILVKEISNQWKFLMRFLDVKEEDIENICASNPNSTINEQAVLVLEDKLKSCEDDLKWENVEIALLLLRRFDVIKKIKEKIFSQYDNDYSKEKSSLNCKTNQLATIALDIALNWMSIIDKLNMTDIDREGLKRTIALDNKEYPPEEKAYQCLIKLNKHFENGISLEEIRDAVRAAEDIKSDVQEKIISKIHNFIPSDINFVEKGNQEHNIQTEWGFVVITHSNAKELDNIHNSGDFNNKFDKAMETRIAIPRGGGLKKFIRISEFCETESEQYVEKYFGNHDFFCFNYDSESNESLIESFKTYLQKKGTGFLIKDYDLMKHFEFLKLHDCITDYHFSTFKSSHKMDFIGVEKENRAIYFIKKSYPTTSRDLMQDFKDSAAYIRMFMLLHKEKLKDKISCLLPLIVIPTASEHLINETNVICTSCGDFVITEETFLQIDELDNLLNKLVCNSFFNFGMWDKLKTYEFKNFKYAIADIFCFMACEDINLIPCLSDDVSEQIDCAKILFSPTQVELSNLKDKKVVLVGSFGSGKTLVARSFLRKLSFHIEEHEYIHYINFGSSSDLTKDMNKFVESLPNKKQVICQSIYEEKYTCKLIERLKSTKSSHTENTTLHLIFDEVPISDWTEEEVKEFIEILKEPQFADSYCLIICQPMERKRSFTKDSINFNHSFTEQIYMLIRESRFKKKTLHQIFRNTNKIEELAKYTKNILQEYINTFHLEMETEHDSDIKTPQKTEELEQQSSKTPVQIEKDERKDKFISKFNFLNFFGKGKSKERKSAEYSEVSKKSPLKLDLGQINKSSVDLKPATSQVLSVKENIIGKSSQRNKEIENELKEDHTNIKNEIKENHANIDSKTNAAKFTSESGFDSISNLDRRLESFNRENYGNKVFLRSEYTYCYDGETIHNIEGFHPLLYFLFFGYDEFENIYLVSLCFENIVRTRKVKADGKIIIIHFEDESPIVFDEALLFLKENSKLVLKNLIIKSFTETQGCEYDNVIIYLKTCEYHLRHYLVEAITRCKCNLFFFVVNESQACLGDSLLWRLTEDWRKLNLVKEVPIDNLNYDHNILCGLKENYERQVTSRRQEKKRKFAEENSSKINKLIEDTFGCIVNFDSLSDQHSATGSIHMLIQLGMHFTFDQSC